MDKDIAAFQAYQGSQAGLPKQYQQFMGGQAAAKKKTRTGIGSIIGGTIGGIAGGTLGTFLAPGAGTVAGGIAGGAGGSALGEALDQILTGGKITSGNQIAGEAVLGAAPGVLGTGLKVARGARAGLGLAEVLAEQGAKGAADGAISAAGKYTVKGNLQNSANSVLASQYGTISKPVARQTRIVETVGKLANYGITKPADAERIAGQFTGGTGVVSNAVRTAVGTAGKIDPSGMKDIAKKLIVDQQIDSSKAKSLMNFLNVRVAKLGGGNSNDAFDVIKRLEAKAADLTGKGGTYHLPTSDDVALAKVHTKLAEELKTRLYSQADIKSVLTPKLRSDLVGLHPGNSKWAKFVDGEVMQSKDVGQLRSTMAPFVKIGKAIDEGDVNALTAGGRVGNSLAGGPLGQALNAFAGTQTAKRVTAGALKGAGAVAGAPITQATGKGAMALTGQGAGRAITAPFVNPSGIMARGAAGNQMAGSNDANPLADGMTFGNQDQSGMDSFNQGQGAIGSQDPTQQDQTNNPFSDENIKIMALQDIQTTGGKNLDKISQLSKLFGSTTTKPKPMGATQAKDANLASSGLRALGALEQMGQADPSAHIKGALPGQFGAHDYAAARREAMDAIVRLRTGAAMSAKEEAFYTKMFPGATDSPQVASQKIKQIRQYLTGVANPIPSGFDAPQATGLLQ